MYLHLGMRLNVYMISCEIKKNKHQEHFEAQMKA